MNNNIQNGIIFHKKNKELCKESNIGETGQLTLPKLIAEFKSKLLVILLTGFLIVLPYTWSANVNAQVAYSVPVPLYRLYNAAIGDHFYTTSSTERDNAFLKYGYRYEDITGYVYPPAYPP